MICVLFNPKGEGVQCFQVAKIIFPEFKGEKNNENLN